MLEEKDCVNFIRQSSLVNEFKIATYKEMANITIHLLRYAIPIQDVELI